ncbi:unnamed protein product [Rhodiola kirilowii]
MGVQESRDPLKGTDWGTIASVASKQSATATATATAVKRRPRTKIREIPECYFLPRRPWYVNLGIYGSCIAGGIGAGMLIEIWINKKIKEDGGGRVLWEFGKD